MSGNETVRDRIANPGSDEAAEQGCLCPRMDNAYGRGYLGGMRDDDGELLFVRRSDCPLHGAEEDSDGR